MDRLVREAIESNCTPTTSTETIGLTWATHGAPSSKCSNYPEAHQWQSKDKCR
jgi:hypothetical protein